jgi:hypothetical protein
MSKKFNRITQGPSSFELVEIEDPAAGADFFFSFEDGYTYRIQSMNFLLTCSAVVADRWPYIEIRRGGRYIGFLSPAGKIIASEAVNFHWMHGLTNSDASAVTPHIICQLPRNLYLIGKDVLRTATFNIDVGDQLTEVVLYLQKWPMIED